MTIKQYEERRNDIVTMWENTDLNRKEVSQIFKMHHTTICEILRLKHAEKRDRLKELSSKDVNPCTLKLSVWPRCFGGGCYHAKGQGSTCPAYTAMQKIA